MSNDPPTTEVRTVNETFSDYVARLGTHGEPPDEASYNAVREELRSLLVRELHRRGNQQCIKGNIRPLIVLNVGHLLTELQKKADPLGYRVFGRLREAIEKFIGRGKLHALDVPKSSDRHRRIRNETVLSFRPGLAPLTSRHLGCDSQPGIYSEEGR